jgi:hypothetical protein
MPGLGLDVQREFLRRSGFLICCQRPGRASLDAVKQCPRIRVIVDDLQETRRDERRHLRPIEVAM